MPVAVARADSTPKRPAATPRPRPAAKPSNPITQLQADAGHATDRIRRETAAFTRWLSHTGTEVQRGLESADQTVKRWTGGCTQPQGCNSSDNRVVRRDRWSRRHGGETVSQPGPNELPMPYAHDDADAASTSRPPQYYR